MSLDLNQNVGKRFSFVAGLCFLICAAVAQADVGSKYSSEELRAVETQEEATVRELSQQEVTQIRITLGRRTPTNRRADLYLRLAELYMENYRLAFLVEGRAHEKRLEKGIPVKFIDRSFSRPYLLAGIKACEEIIKLRIPFSRMDNVYYFLGFANAELERKKESRKFFEIIAQKYPSSPYSSDAIRRLGDDAFANNDFRRAQNLFERAIATEKVENRARLYHKLAWSFYRTKQYSRAVESMKEAISITVKYGESHVSLKEEALRDMAIFMTETGRVDEAIGYFEKVAGDKNFYSAVLEKLGKQYERNVQPDKAIQVYEALLRARPEEEASFRAMTKLVDLDLRRGRYKDALVRLKTVKNQTSGDHETQVAAQNLRAMVRRTATEAHETYRKKGSKTSLYTAEDYYSSYLRYFLSKDDPRKETAEIQMYLADVKRELGKSAEASELYRRVLDSKDKRYAKEAGILWTASLAESMKKAGSNKGKEPSQLEQEFISAADEMQDALGEVPEAREAAVKAAQVLAGYKASQSEAIKRTKKIIKKWPETPQAVLAGRLWLQLLVDDAGALDDLKDVIVDLKNNKALMSTDSQNGGKLASIISDQEMRIKVGVIAKQEGDKDFAAAGASYENFAAETQKRELVEKAYANAIGSYLKIGDFAAIRRVGGIWLKRYEKKPGTESFQSLRTAATNALIKGLFEEAAFIFEQIGRSGDSDGLETAARINEAIGATVRAQSLWSSYLSIYPRSKQRWTVALLQAQSFEADQKDAEAAKSYKYCFIGPDAFEAECGARLGDLYLRLQNIESAKSVFKKVAQQKITAVTSPFVAYARYRLADLIEREMKFEPLQLPESQLKKALNQRISFLDPLSAAYKSAVEAGGPWAIAALDRLALFANNFATEIDSIRPPAGLTPQAAEEFNKSMASVSAPLKKKAFETWKSAYGKAISEAILSPVLPEIADRLVDGRIPSVYRAQGPKGGFSLAGLPTNGGAEGRDSALETLRDRLIKNPKDAKSWTDYGNLLFGEGKVLLARIAYEQASLLDPSNVAALNNRGVVLLGDLGEEDWIKAIEANWLFNEALKKSEFFVPALANRAILLNYYRIFNPSLNLWQQVVAQLKRDIPSNYYDGLSVFYAGIGKSKEALDTFQIAEKVGAPKDRFVKLFIKASLNPTMDKDGGKKCLSFIDDIEDEDLRGFEKESVERLKRICSVWAKN